MSTRSPARWFVIAIPYLWLAVFFLAPFVIVLRIALSEPVLGQPPYQPVFDVAADGLSGTWDKLKQLSLDNFAFIASDSLYIDSYLSSLRIAAIATLLLLVTGFPVAYAMARAPERWRSVLLMLVILPFWTSFLIRVYAWIGILRTEGALNTVLQGVGLISEPLRLLNTETAVFIGLVYTYLPFMVLPLYATMEKLDDSLYEAASDLGCPPWKAFWVITVPLAVPGIVAGCFLCFIPIIGEFVVPELLGGSDTLMIGKTLWTEFFNNGDWPVASAVAVILLALLVVPIVLYQSHQQRQMEAGQ